MENNLITMLDKLNKGMGTLAKVDSERMEAFMAFVEATEKPGALDMKTKQLITLAIALYAHCEGCIADHTRLALKAGATPKELVETAFVACFMGGGPAMAKIATVLVDSIHTFAPEFSK
jgi:AhpD family alkylhydroperoxidase